MKPVIVSVAVSVLAAASVIAHPLEISEKECVPGSNCKLPECRCWFDPTAPGGFVADDIPQIIILSFNYAVNNGNVRKYTDLLKGIKNPNCCPVRGSYFVTEEYTDFTVAERLYEEGHEVGVNTIDTRRPSNADQWAGNFSEVAKKLRQAGIPSDSILGSSGPDLYFGGNEYIYGMTANKLKYNTNCATIKFDAGHYLWPFTYDYIDDVPECTVGKPVTREFPGIWQFMVADLEYKGHKCSVPSACLEFINSTQEAYDLFFSAFEQHYKQKTRPPFMVTIDPLWLSDAARLRGTRQFLLDVSTSYEDIWIVTAQQALAWIESPVSAHKAGSFKPWSC